MYEMTIRFQPDGKSCLYEQIYGHIKKEIREGRLLAGERLPSTRFLAEYLQVARSTVDSAYSQLVAEGYITSRPYRGYYVCSMEEMFGPEALCRETASKAAAFPETLSGNEESAAVSDEAAWEFDFSPYEIDMSGFPLSVWKKITKKILTEERGIWICAFPSAGTSIPPGGSTVRRSKSLWGRETIIFFCCWKRFWDGM